MVWGRAAAGVLVGAVSRDKEVDISGRRMWCLDRCCLLGLSVLLNISRGGVFIHIHNNTTTIIKHQRNNNENAIIEIKISVSELRSFA